MEKNRKNRVVMLGALLALGLVLAGLGTALGVGEAFQGIEKSFGVVITCGQVTISEEGKTVVLNFTLPEGENYAWKTSNGAIHIFTMTEEEIEKSQTEIKADMNRFLEIAKRDSRVQELIEGKEYDVAGTGTCFKDGEKDDTTLLMLEVEGKDYMVTIDTNRETVESIEEQQNATGFSVSSGPDGEITWSEGVQEGVQRPAIQER